MQQSPLNNSAKINSLVLSNASTPSERSKTFDKNFNSTPYNRFIRPSMDSQLSTSSGSPNLSPQTSRLGSYHDLTDTTLDNPNARFPILVQNKIAKLKAKMNASNRKEQQIKAAEDPVNEEKEEFEKETHFLKRLPVVADAEEFNVKGTQMNRLRGRDIVFRKELSRCKSTEASCFVLDPVQEDKNEEEFNSFKQRRKIEDLNISDLDEFNQHTRVSGEKKSKRKFSLQFKPEEAIMEEQEKTSIPHFQSIFVSSNSSHHGSLHSSPGPKLKVDELDLKEKKPKAKEDDEEECIDPIMEETEERNMQVADNKEYQAAKHKLNEEREFLKKVIKGEMINENTSVHAKMNPEREYSYVGSGVIEEIIEEDRNENVNDNVNN